MCISYIFVLCSLFQSLSLSLNLNGVIDLHMLAEGALRCCN